MSFCVVPKLGSFTVRSIKKSEHFSKQMLCLLTGYDEIFHCETSLIKVISLVNTRLPDVGHIPILVENNSKRK